MVSCLIPQGKKVPPSLIVANMSSCSSNSEDRRIRFYLHNRTILYDLWEARDLGPGLVKQSITNSIGRGRRSYLSHGKESAILDLAPGRKPSIERVL